MWHLLYLCNCFLIQMPLLSSLPRESSGMFRIEIDRKHQQSPNQETIPSKEYILTSILLSLLNKENLLRNKPNKDPVI
jgi:hypothetical protein